MIDVLITAATLGGLYALVAMGLTLQFGVARILNLAHGEFLVVAAFFSFALVTSAGLHPILVLALAIPLGFGVQWAVYQVLLAPLARRAASNDVLVMDSILVTFGLLFVVQGAVLAGFGGSYYSYSYLSIPLDVLGTKVAANRLLACGVALAICLTLYFALERSRWGTAMRAVAIAPQFAHLVGIDVRSMSALAFGLGGAMVAASGVLISTFLPISAAMGIAFTLKALVVTIMGGIGNLMGCLIAGLLLGLTETLVSRLVDPGLTLASTFAIFLLVLLLRPAGLFGKSTR
jgi:branched-chain amino acid transport system permease protein